MRSSIWQHINNNNHKNVRLSCWKYVTKSDGHFSTQMTSVSSTSTCCICDFGFGMFMFLWIDCSKNLDCVITKWKSVKKMSNSLPYSVLYSTGEQSCKKCAKIIQFNRLQMAIMIQVNLFRSENSKKYEKCVNFDFLTKNSYSS